MKFSNKTDLENGENLEENDENPDTVENTEPGIRAENHPRFTTLIIKRIVHELKFFRFLKIPSYKSNLL